MGSVKSVLNLTMSDLHQTLPMEVVSTGLPYLLIPLCIGLERAKICVCDIEPLLEQFGAKFVYVFHVQIVEGRTWDNKGIC